MSTSDISKEICYDPRIRQLPPRYAIQEGALSVTAAPFAAVSQSTSNHQYNINAPSLQVFIDRALKWTSTFRVQFTVTTVGAAVPSAIFALGVDGALCAFPLNTLVSTMTANINDASVTFQTDQVLREVLRLANAKRDRLQRTCPTMLDKYAKYADAAGAVNNPCASYSDATDYDNVPNGAWYDIQYIYPDNTTVGGTPGDVVTGAYTAGGVVHAAPAAAGQSPQTSAAAAAYTIALQVTCTEKLVLPPFIFADDHEWDIGLTGINNIQISMALGNGISRVIRSTSPQGGASRTVSAVRYYNGQGGAFPAQSRIDVTFLTPNLSLDLPAKSVVPFSTYNRYVTAFTGANLAAGAVANDVASSTVTLPGLPDKVLIFAKPRAYSPADGDFYLPISKISVNLNNFSGLLSSMKPADLYAMSVHNGLEMDYNAWRGKARAANSAGGLVPLVGGFLVLALGQDLALQAAEAPGLQGQVTFQFNCTLENTTAAVIPDYDLYMVPVFSGFFESVAGSSRLVQNILSPDDIINAPVAPEGSVAGLQRITGGGFFDTLGNALSKGMEIYQKTKPLISAAKGLLPEEGKLGTVKSVLGKVGYGKAGAGQAGAGMSGAAMLSKRLM